jgi:hypothetical protein
MPNVHIVGRRAFRKFGFKSGALAYEFHATAIDPGNNVSLAHAGAFADGKDF